MNLGRFNTDRVDDVNLFQNTGQIFTSFGGLPNLTSLKKR